VAAAAALTKIKAALPSNDANLPKSIPGWARGEWSMSHDMIARPTQATILGLDIADWLILIGGVALIGLLVWLI
jgi:hypothetical protein